MLDFKRRIILTVITIFTILSTKTSATEINRRAIIGASIPNNANLVLKININNLLKSPIIKKLLQESANTNNDPIKELKKHSIDPNDLGTILIFGKIDKLDPYNFDKVQLNAILTLKKAYTYETLKKICENSQEGIIEGIKVLSYPLPPNAITAKNNTHPKNFYIGLVNGGKIIIATVGKKNFVNMIQKAKKGQRGHFAPELKNAIKNNGRLQFYIAYSNLPQQPLKSTRKTLQMIDPYNKYGGSYITKIKTILIGFNLNKNAYAKLAIGLDRPMSVKMLDSKYTNIINDKKMVLEAVGELDNNPLIQKLKLKPAGKIISAEISLTEKDIEKITKQIKREIQTNNMLHPKRGASRVRQTAPPI